MSAAAQPARKPAKAKASTYPTTWPGTTVVKSTSTPFNWQGAPSEIVAADPQMRAKKTGPKPAPVVPCHIHSLSKKADKRLRDNTVSNFSTPIPGLADADKQRRIKASTGSAVSQPKKTRVSTT